MISTNLKAQNTAAHTVQAPPATSFTRGVFVDCANEIIVDMSAGNQTKKNNLIAYLNQNSIKYIALFKLDNNNVIGNATLEPFLRTFIGDVRAAVPGIQIGAIGSSKTFFQQSPFLNVSSYLSNLCDPNPNNTMKSISQINGIVNPTNPTPAQIQKAELFKFFLKAGKFTVDTTPGFAAIPPDQRCNRAFDFIYAEIEYWTASTGAQKNQQYNDLKDCLSIMQQIKCLYTCIKNVDCEFNPSLFSYTNSSGSLVTVTRLNQIVGVDALADRVTIPSYVTRNNAALTFEWKCDTYKEFADPSTKKRSKIFVQPSSEKIGWTNCDPQIGSVDFLGPYLNGDAGGPTGNMYSVELPFYNKYQNPGFVCPNCNCSTYTANHYSSTNQNGNEILGAVWFTYTIMQSHNITRMAAIDGSHESDNEVNVYPNIFSNQTEVRSSISKLQEVVVFDINGKQLMRTSVDGLAQNLQLDFSNIPSGTYIIQATDIDHKIYNTKVQCVK
ncbi:MAG: Secretion system C-terminal sorting domain [Bacteroidota bacterium]|jgi:hypothetical protein